MGLRLRNSSGNYVELNAPSSIGTDVNLVLPNTDGSSGQYLQTDGSGALSWATIAGVKLAVIADQKSNNTDGGTFTSGAWRTRDLNTEVYDADSIVSISSNQFTLGAGTYYISWAAPAAGVIRHVSRLYNVTGAASVSQSTNSYDYPDPSLPLDAGYSIGSAVIAPTSNTAYEIQHRGESTLSSTGFGISSGFGTYEQYTTVTILKVA